MNAILPYLKNMISSPRERRMNVLYRLSGDLAAAETLHEVLEATRTNLREVFNCRVGIFLWQSGKIELSVLDHGFPADQGDYAQLWVEGVEAENSKSDLVQASAVHYAPLQTSKGVFGVLGISFKKKRAYRPEDNDLLIAFANQSAVAIQRTKLAEISRQVEMMHEREKLHTALLNSISHDLRTPLVSIMGVLSSLLQDYSSLDSKTREELLATAYQDSDHLNRFVGNLLDMTRLEAKALKLRVEPYELRDVVGASLQTLKDEVERRKISIHIPSDFPEIPMDFVLMMRVFVNLIDNALKYSALEAPIEITAVVRGEKAKVDIKDAGIGIPKEDLNKIFDKFYRATKPRQVSGTGLGLSICKGIVEAHGGTIMAKNNSEKGATFSLELPLVARE